MSSSILKRSLDLFDEDDTDTNTKKTKGSKGKGVEKRKSSKKNLLKKRQKVKTGYKNNLPEDKTEESLQFLERLAKVDKTDGQIAKTILTYNKGRLSKNEEKLEPIKDSTVFTSRDFEKFEEEYDFFS